VPLTKTKEAPLGRLKIKFGRSARSDKTCIRDDKTSIRSDALNTFQYLYIVADCGTALDPTSPLVIGGNLTKPSLWPWHATIFKRHPPSSQFEFRCGGTLIKPLSYNPGFVILSAAHCFVREAGDSIDMADYKVILGAETSLGVENNTDVPNVQIHNVKNIDFSIYTCCYLMYMLRFVCMRSMHRWLMMSKDESRIQTRSVHRDNTTGLASLSLIFNV
jgi:hypothetical protein